MRLANYQIGTLLGPFVSLYLNPCKEGKLGSVVSPLCLHDYIDTVRCCSHQEHFGFTECELNAFFCIAKSLPQADTRTFDTGID